MDLELKVQPDHLERIATSKNPLGALSELIWNALDADASTVQISVKRSNLNGIETISIQDDGEGLEYVQAQVAFQKLGGSWKKGAKVTKGKRALHGQNGQGRYKAFSLGNSVLWRSVYQASEGNLKTFDISGSHISLNKFRMTDPVPVMKGFSKGMLVEVSSLRKSFTKLDDPDAVARNLALNFALYMRQYPTVKIQYDGANVDPSSVESHYQEYDLGDISLQDGSKHKATLVVIEWAVAVDRALHFCDASGASLDQKKPDIQAPGFSFTAYVKSDAVRVLHDKDAFAFEDGHPEVEELQKVVKKGMKDHFRQRQAELATDLIKEWKAEDVYPYKGDATNPLEVAERQVFDVIAKNVHDYLPNFEKSDPVTKRFSLRLLKHALESSSGDIQKILQEVLNLPADKAKDLAELLDRTSLSAIINASKIVADRLDFLHGLEMLLYHPESKEQLLERAQLQKILEDHTWIFGEAFNLTVADQSLNKVLEKHLEKMGRTDGVDFEAEVLRPDGKKGIVDLMLARSIPQARADELEYLVIEIKRPSQKINAAVLAQADSYASAVALDERFHSIPKVKWIVWAVSNELTDEGRRKVTQINRPFGLYADNENPSVQVWAMPWSRIINDCRARLQFYKEKLEYTATDETAMGLLRKAHEKYLPECFAEEKPSKSSSVIPILEPDAVAEVTL